MQKQIWLVVTTLVFSGVVFAQTPTPPVKTGLWQTTNTVTISGLQIPPDVAARLQAMGRPLPTGQPSTSVTQSCLTTEKWENMFRDMQRDHDCHLTNQRQTPSTLSADMVCKSADGRRSSTGHIEANFLSPEKMHGKAHIETMAESQPHPIVVDMSFDSVYQGADCKGISPDSSRAVH